MKKILRKIHRWLGLLMALQIIAWMASGLYFAWFPIEIIRGEHLTASVESPNSQALMRLGAGNQLVDALDDHFEGGYLLGSVSALSRNGEPFWRVSGDANGIAFTRLVDGQSGQVVEMIDEQAARRIAVASINVPGIIVSAEYLVESAAETEYRARPVPAWRVSFSEPEGIRLYLDAWTGEVTARRTDRWRVFDFLWMLHIMDFDTRDDFNTPLLQIAALLGLLIALSGVAYWCMTTRLFRRRYTPSS